MPFEQDDGQPNFFKEHIQYIQFWDHIKYLEMFITKPEKDQKKGAVSQFPRDFLN